LAEAAADTSHNAVCLGGGGAAAGNCGSRRFGTGADNGRTAPDQRRGGCCNIAASAGGATGMIHLPASVRVYLCLTACDMRKSFDGLHQLVRDYLQLDAFAGHLFVFSSRRRDRLKILYWGVSRM